MLLSQFRKNLWQSQLKTWNKKKKFDETGLHKSLSALPVFQKGDFIGLFLVTGSIFEEYEYGNKDEIKENYYIEKGQGVVQYIKKLLDITFSTVNIFSWGGENFISIREQAGIRLVKNMIALIQKHVDQGKRMEQIKIIIAGHSHGNEAD